VVKRITVEAEGRLTRKDAESVVDAVFRHIRQAVVSDGRFSCSGFGSWAVRKRKARKGSHPRTREPLQVPEDRTVRFQAAPALRKRIYGSKGSV
jgi:DNA-binding protein HU-beta